MRISRNVRTWAAVVFIGASMTGCTPASVNATPEAVPANSGQQIAMELPESASRPIASEPKQTANPLVPPDQASPPSAGAGKEVQTSSDHKPAATPDETSPVVEYDTKKPSLAGIRLTETKTAILQRLGEPEEQYTMDDEKDPIVVYEYIGFSVGFNAKEFVEFIEITSMDVNPGLNGLRLGDLAEDAKAALGNPNTNTKYALQYKAGGTILKLDIDPKTEKIQSIKLFADAK